MFKAKSAIGVDPMHMSTTLIKQNFMTGEEEDVQPEVRGDVALPPTIDVINIICLGRIDIHVNIRVIEVR